MSNPYTPATAAYVALNWTLAIHQAHQDGNHEEYRRLMRNIDRDAAPSIILLLLPFLFDYLQNNPLDGPESPHTAPDEDGGQ